jgi:hypothetical protein
LRAWRIASLALASCSFNHGKGAPDGQDRSDGANKDASPRLIDRGLVARYLIAEAASGSAPTALIDAAPSPLPLPITYSPNFQYTTVTGHRGIQWAAMAAHPARATAPISGTKVAARLGGATTWTLEVVVDVQALSPPGGIDCRIITLANGTTTYGDAALVTSDLTHVNLFVNGVATTWAVTEASGRHVLHAVVDTAPVDPAQRAQLYVDGAPATLGGGAEPLQGETLTLAASESLSIGNVDTGGRSFIGVEYYAALYDVALSPTEVAANASALGADDDSN